MKKRTSGLSCRVFPFHQCETDIVAITHSKNKLSKSLELSFKSKDQENIGNKGKNTGYLPTLDLPRVDQKKTDLIVTAQKLKLVSRILRIRTETSVHLLALASLTCVNQAYKFWAYIKTSTTRLKLITDSSGVASNTFQASYKFCQPFSSTVI